MHPPGCTLHYAMMAQHTPMPLLSISQMQTQCCIAVRWPCLHTPLRFGLHHAMVIQHTQTHTLFANFLTCKLGFALQLDDDLAEEVAPGSGGVQGLQTQLLRMQNAKTAQDNEEAVEEALMETVVHLAQCDVPYSMVKEMGQQEYQARLHTAQAKVILSLIPLSEIQVPCDAKVGPF